MDLKQIKEILQKIIKGKNHNEAMDNVDSDPQSDKAVAKAEEENTKTIEKENENLSQVKMTSGKRDPTLGINKKVVNMAIIFVILIVVVAFLYKSMDSGSEDTGSQQKSPNQQETAANNLPNGNNSTLDYKNPEVMKLTQAQQSAQNGNNSRNVANASANPANKENQQNNNQNKTAASTAPKTTATAAPVPRTVPTPVTYTPTTTVQPQQAVRQSEEDKVKSDAEKKAEQEEKDLLDRFKSAISFAIGGSSSTSGSTDGAETTGTASSANSSNTYAEPSGNVLQAGTTIPVMLYSGINTDTAGQVTAQVQADVYDSATGTNLLIPAGSRIIGGYEQGANESGRVNVTFSTIVLPNGGSYSIGDSMVAVDGQGYNGIQGKLHRHTAAQIGHGILNSAITALSTISVDRVTLGQDALGNLTASDVKPTITVEPGYEFNIYVTKAISFGN